MRAARLASIVLIGSFAGCAAETGAEDSPDGRDDVGLTAGKADGTEFNDCELEAVVNWVNDPGTTLDTLRTAGVHSRAAKNIIEHRNGADREYGTDDDRLFEDIVQIDDVYYVGATAIRQLVDAIRDRCVDPGASDIEVVFSPQPWPQSHLARTAAQIDRAERSIDIAMYSFSDAEIMNSLVAARGRGVTIRMVFDPASEHRTSPMGTQSARIEEAGIEVRWINKVMHHKFAIIDGVRTDGDDPSAATLVTGSGNWSNSAGTKYEENTLFIRRSPELALRFQREFNHLWEHSRALEWNEDIEYFTSAPITDDMIAAQDDFAVDAFFTSVNFRAYESTRYGWTFSPIRGERNVAAQMAEIISRAETSIHVASGHLRSRIIADAIMAKVAEDPSIDVRVYLDGQEWISEWYDNEQDRDYQACLDAATSDNDIEDCTYGGTYFSYDMAQAGVPLRFKYYAYRWDYSYAEQMHHKFFVVDGRYLVTGSYNWSDNAETNTMENVVLIDGDKYPAVVAAFEGEFERMWTTGEGLYEPFLDEVQNGTGAFDIVFTPMALEWEQVDVLKSAIRAACADIDSAEWRDNPSAHRRCYR